VLWMRGKVYSLQSPVSSLIPKVSSLQSPVCCLLYEIMDDEVLVRVENVSKKFCKSLKRSLWYGVQDIASELNPFAKPSRPSCLCGEDIAPPASLKTPRDAKDDLPPLRRDEFWAVKDVSFELKRGECLGLIGHNGAGKSTLLKMLNGIIKPDAGRIEMRGRICAMIELGAGFNPILTGRENIYNRGAVLGFSRQEVAAKYDEIVDFAEIGDFLEMPVQNYSSGMRVRLGFAVAALMDPDVLIIDEVLAVGDMGFAIKCFNMMTDLMRRASVILVTHNMPVMARVATQAMLMERGIVTLQSVSIGSVIEAYMINFKAGRGMDLGLRNAKIISVSLTSPDAQPGTVFQRNASVVLRTILQIDPDYKRFGIIIYIFNLQQRAIIEYNSFQDEMIFDNPNSPVTISTLMPLVKLNPGKYTITIAVTDDACSKALLRRDNAIEFQVAGEYISYAETYDSAQWMLA
jgi:lipopolysaccharide transport system ATP-binding protein